jgi:hypothetical protein
MANNCSKCGKDINLVGRVHNCGFVIGRTAFAKISAVEKGVMPPDTPVAKPAAYLYRDPDKRRTYMREHMKNKRKKARCLL